MKLDGKSIGIITSGGDCGGLNAVVKGAALMAKSYGVNSYIIPNGYAGLYNLLESGNIIKLDLDGIEQICSLQAGSEAGNSRVKISRIKDPDKYKKISKGLEKHNIGALIISGGDDTGSVVVDLKNKGIPCIHVPKTMDLDLQTYSVGADSAINRISQYIRDLKTTGKSHNRMMVIEVFGRYSGQIALRGGIAAEADCILVPEVEFDFDIVYEHMKKTFTRRVINSTYKAGTYTIVVAEGISDVSGQSITDKSVSMDSFGHKKLSGTGKYIREVLVEKIRGDADMKDFMKKQGLFVEDMNEVPEIREVVPTYLVRSGNTSAFDVKFGLDAGAGAAVLLMNGISGVTVQGVVNGVVEYVPVEKAIEKSWVNENVIAFYEKMGICFGRNVSKSQPGITLAETATCYYI